MPRSRGPDPPFAGTPHAPPDDGGVGVGVSAGGAVTTIIYGVAVAAGSVSGSGGVVPTITIAVFVGKSAAGVTTAGASVGGTEVEVKISSGVCVASGVSSTIGASGVGVSSTPEAVAVSSNGTSVGTGVIVGGSVAVAVGSGIRASSWTRPANADAPAWTPL